MKMCLKKSFGIIICLVLSLTLILPVFGADKTCKGTTLKVGYYTATDGTTGMQVTEKGIVVYEMYDGSSKMYSEKEALKKAIVSDQTGKITEAKSVIKASGFTISKSGKTTTIQCKDFKLKMTYAGAKYADAVKLAKKRLDPDFS